MDSWLRSPPAGLRTDQVPHAEVATGVQGNRRVQAVQACGTPHLQDGSNPELQGRDLSRIQKRQREENEDAIISADAFDTAAQRRAYKHDDKEYL